MLRYTRLIAITLVLLVLGTGSVDAQRQCPNCRKQVAPRRTAQPLMTARQRRENENRQVQRAQHSRPIQAQEMPLIQAQEMPPIPPRFNVAQNPLDELQQELEESTDETTGDFLDNLDNLSGALQDDGDAEPPAEGEMSAEDAIDEILRGRDDRDRAVPEDRDSERSPLSGLEDDEKNDVEAESDEIRRPNPGLRDDSYYRSLGAPKMARRSNRRNQPMTLGDVFGNEDEYDCQCQQQYCQQMWDCAGGRGQGWCSRNRRSRNRMNIVRNSAGNCQPYVNECKCPKISDNPNQRNPRDRTRSTGQESGYGQRGPFRGDPVNDGGIYDTGVIGDGYYDLEPLPSDIPRPLVDET